MGGKHGLVYGIVFHHTPIDGLSSFHKLRQIECQADDHGSWKNIGGISTVPSLEQLDVFDEEFGSGKIW